MGHLSVAGNFQGNCMKIDRLYIILKSKIDFEFDIIDLVLVMLRYDNRHFEIGISLDRNNILQFRKR